MRKPPERFTLVVFYRGLHCPICIKYLLELGRLLPEFAKRGVERDRALGRRRRARAGDGRQGEGAGSAVRLSPAAAVARQWGLYTSTGRGKTSIGIEEPALFAEPGVFIVRPDGTLYYGAVQTMPFARPHFDELVAALDFAIDKNYPARGEYTGAV